MSAVNHYPSYDSLQQTIWSELCLAVAEQGHSWRTPVLATVDLQGMPNARVVVMRAVDVARQQLIFYTDRRSPKVSELQKTPETTLVFWSEKRRWQLRVDCLARVIEDGEVVDAVWGRVSATPGAADYLASTAPGSPLSLSDSVKSRRHYLAIVELTVHTMDWLALTSDDHRRALLANGVLTWLVP